MRKQGYEEELIEEATSFGETTDEKILEARKTYQALKEKHNVSIQAEAEKVIAAGGLFILGTERHESRRIDNQLRGRSGRQGDPGESKFFISLEDDLMRLFGNNERIIAMIDRLGVDEDTPIQARILSNTIESAQKRIEDQNFKRRKYVLAYDDVMNQQRNLIYKQRQQVLDDEDLTETLRHMIHETIEATVLAHTADDHAENWELDGLRASLLGYVCRDEDLRYSPEQLKSLKREDLLSSLLAQADQRLAAQEQLFTPDTFREVERVILLQNVDRAWMDHLDAMDELKNDIGLQAYANRDPVNEYRLVGADMFDAMVAEIRDKTVRMLLTVAPKPREEIKRVQVAKPLIEGFEGGSKPSAKKVVLAPRRAAPKVGRNDPCPCGSGKKYKNCCGSNVNRTM